MTPVTSPRFILLIPVKDSVDAKSRLGGADTGRRLGLRRAFAQDAVAAAGSSSLVEAYVVGDSHDLGEVGCLPDEGAGDLNLALVLAAERVRRPGLGVAALLADLPCLVSDDLDEALLAAGARASFVADAAGTGTTLLASPDGVAFEPRFGIGSAALHRAAGARPIPGPLASLRLDVDTPADLEAAIALGVGAHTRAALAATPSTQG